MSKLTDSIQGVQAALATLFPSPHSEITNSLRPEQSTENTLKQGFGLRIGRGENSERFASCKRSEFRTLVVINTRQAFAKEFDIELKQATERLLLNDQDLVKARFESDPTVIFGGTTANVKWVDDGGIDQVFSDKENFIKIETVLQIEVFENL